MFFFFVEKKSAQIAALYSVLPGARLGVLRFCTVYDKSTLRVQSGTHLTFGGAYFSACPKYSGRAPHRPARTVFCGTLIYSLNLRMNHMILVVKTSEEYVTFATPTRFFHVYFSTLSPIKSEAVSFWYEVFFSKLHCECDDTGKLLWWYSTENIWGFRESRFANAKIAA